MCEEVYKDEPRAEEILTAADILRAIMEVPK
jgi:hypothetical protein